ncbi:MAG: PQQ-like beta-propeller repeat protein [Vitreoscilla sp.]|nr:PQQ-like beta-propeller repeat protein [Vitreoscilla sp.]
MTQAPRARLVRRAFVLACAVSLNAHAATEAVADEKIVHLADWATHNGNARHTGYVPMITKPETFFVKWKKKLKVSGALNIAATGGGNAYVSDQVYFQTGHLYALSLADGSIVWSHEFTSNTFGGIPSMHAPAFHNGMAVVSTGGHEDAALWGYDAATGDLKFRSQISAQWETYLAPTPFANTLYMNGGYYGGAYGFNSRNGGQRWFTGLDQYDHWTPAVDNDYVYAYTTHLDVLDRRTGAIVKTIADPGFEWWGYSVGCAPVLGDQGEVLVTNAHRLVSFDLATNSINWVQPVDAGYYALNQISLANGIIYYGKGNFVTVRKESSGKQVALWQAPAGATIESAVVVTKNLFFVSTDAGTYAVDREALTGFVWKNASHGQLSLSREGVLLITSADGVVTAVQVGS